MAFGLDPSYSIVNPVNGNSPCVDLHNVISHSIQLSLVIQVLSIITATAMKEMMSSV